jgi:ribosomal protein L40E
MADIIERYRDLYHVAGSTVAVGQLVKIGGAVLGAILAIFGLASGRASDSTYVSLIGLAGGALVGFTFFALGSAIAALGQLLKAIGDIAVNTWTESSPIRLQTGVSPEARPATSNAPTKVTLCAKCQSQIPPDIEVCPQCGASSPTKTVCRECGKDVTTDDFHCPHCHVLMPWVRPVGR